MGCGVSTTADPVVVNELKKSRHSRRRMSLDSKFIEERHHAHSDQPSASNVARNETPNAGGTSGRTTSTAFSYETASASSSRIRYPTLRSRYRTWSHTNRVNSEPNTELAYRNFSPSSMSAIAPLATKRPTNEETPSQRPPIAPAQAQASTSTTTRSRLPSAASQADSFILVQRRVVVAWEAPPSLSPIRQQEQHRRRPRERLSRASSCSWPSAAPSAPSSTFGSQTLVQSKCRVQEQKAVNPGRQSVDTNQTPDVESLMAATLRTASPNMATTQEPGSKMGGQTRNWPTTHKMSNQVDSLSTPSGTTSSASQSNTSISASFYGSKGAAMAFRAAPELSNRAQKWLDSEKLLSATISSTALIDGGMEDRVVLTFEPRFWVDQDAFGSHELTVSLYWINGHTQILDTPESIPDMVQARRADLIRVLRFSLVVIRVLVLVLQLLIGQGI